MSDEEPTVAVPVSLIERIVFPVTAGDSLNAQGLLAECLPKPTSRRLRVVDLDDGLVDEYVDGDDPGRSITFDYVTIESAPDVMAIVEQAVQKSIEDGEWSDADELAKLIPDRIRAAIDEAVGRG